MEPMYLKDVEKAMGSDSRSKMIAKMREAGRSAPQIFHMFVFKPAAMAHLERYTQEVMRGPSPLSPGMRELISAFTSSRNHCPF
jgi:hypothetical protein